MVRESTDDCSKEGQHEWYREELLPWGGGGEGRKEGHVGLVTLVGARQGASQALLNILAFIFIY